MTRNKYMRKRFISSRKKIKKKTHTHQSYYVLVNSKQQVVKAKSKKTSFSPEEPF